MIAKESYIRNWRNHSIIMLSMHFFVFITLFGNFIVGTKPLICKYKDEWYVPLFNDPLKTGNQLSLDLREEAQLDYSKLNFEYALWPMISIDPKQMQTGSSWLPPFSKSKTGQFYLFGSYDLGKDVFAGCLIGLHKSLFLAFLCIIISGMIGIVIGSFSMFQSVKFARISIFSVILFCLLIFIIIYAIVLLLSWKTMNISMFTHLLFIGVVLLTGGITLLEYSPLIHFKLDVIALRYIEIMKSIPSLLLLLILLQIFKNPSISGLALLISIFYIPVIAKYARAFTLSISNENYIITQIVIGQKIGMIYWKHILPVLLRKMIPVFAFGIANIIMIEASLSFLGLGIPVDEISLGTLMYAARAYPSAWWVVIFPGLIIFWLILCFNLLGNQNQIHNNELKDDLINNDLKSRVSLIN